MVEGNMALESWLDRYEQIARGNRVRLEFLNKLLDELSRAGLEAVPLKGMDLLLRCSPGLGSRPMCDIDLLVRQTQMGRVSDLLAGKGFQPVRPRPFLEESFVEETLDYHSPDRRLLLDLCWNLWYLDDPEEVWKRTVARPTPIGVRRLLHPEDSFLYLIAYGVAHRGYFSPFFVGDLELFLEREGAGMDWTRWCAQTMRLRLSVPVYHGLTYAKARGLDSIPSQVYRSLSPRRLSERVLARIYSRLVTERSSPKVAYLLFWVGAPGWKAKGKLLRRAFFPPNSSITLRRGKLPRGVLLRAGILRPFRILVRGFYFLSRDLIRLLLG